MIPPFSAALPDTEIDAFLASAPAILRSGRLVLGPYTEMFETAVAAMAGTRYAVAVNSGSTALEIIFRSLDVRGRKVLVPTNTNFATAAAALTAGGDVVLYDAGMYPMPGAIAELLTPDVAAVVVVHIGGYMSNDLFEVVALCAAAGVPLVEDAAHAQGSALEGCRAGGIGHAGASSFFATKVITTGEGGAVTTNDPDLHRMARIYRDQGKLDDQHVVMGGSWRLTELGAALGAVQLAGLDRDIARRRAVIDRYSAELSGTGIVFPTIYGQVSGYKCIAAIDADHDRHRIRAEAAAAGVRLGRGVYEQPLHQHPVFASLDLGALYPAAAEFAARHICLPLWRGITDAQVGAVIEVLSSIFDRK